MLAVGVALEVAQASNPIPIICMYCGNPVANHTTLLTHLREKCLNGIILNVSRRRDNGDQKH